MPDLLGRGRLPEEPEPQGILGAPVAVAFGHVKSEGAEDAERWHLGEIDRLHRPLQLHGKGDRRVLNDGVLHGAPRVRVIGSEQRNVATACLVRTSPTAARVALLENLQHLRVS